MEMLRKIKMVGKLCTGLLIERCWWVSNIRHDGWNEKWNSQEYTSSNYHGNYQHLEAKISSMGSKSPQIFCQLSPINILALFAPYRNWLITLLYAWLQSALILRHNTMLLFYLLLLLKLRVHLRFVWIRLIKRRWFSRETFWLLKINPKNERIYSLYV